MTDKLSGYAHPERLVTTDWLADHLDDPQVVVAESDEDVLLYETGHIPGAVKIDWHADLNDPVVRDYVDGEHFAQMMASRGITRDHTIVFYGDNFNWWAAYALWVFRSERPGRPRLRGRRAFRPDDGLPGHHPRPHDRVLRGQLQLVGGVRTVGLHPLRARGRPPAGRRQAEVDRGGPPAGQRGAEARARELPGGRA